jgi:hypothetical protein
MIDATINRADLLTVMLTQGKQPNSHVDPRKAVHLIISVTIEVSHQE